MQFATTVFPPSNTGNLAMPQISLLADEELSIGNLLKDLCGDNFTAMSRARSTRSIFNSNA